MSTVRVVPASLQAPVQAAVIAAELLSGAAHALRRHAVDTGRADSADALWLLIRTLTAEAEVLARAAAADADAVRQAAGAYELVERRAMAH